MKSLRELSDLRGRVAVITGGAGHIGTAFAEALAELGANIVVLDLDQQRTDTAAEALRAAYGIDTLAIAADVARETELHAVPQRVNERFGRLDVLVNCAAYVGTTNMTGWVVPFEEQSSETWRACLEVNLTSAFVLTQACAPMLAASGRGSVVNVSSIYGMVGPDMRLYDDTAMGNPAAYAASKAGLLQLTRWLATTLAPAIRVNAITPGGVWRNQPEVFVERYVYKTPLRRMAAEEDFKGAIAYLASDLSSYMTGQNLVVDGGWTTW